MDDCFRLGLASGELCAALAETIRSQWHFARLGSGTRAGDRHSVRLLASLRSRWPDRTPQDLLEPKLAFVLGWLCHRAADRQMKPLFRQAAPCSPLKPTECSVYHDAFLFRELYADDPERLYTTATFEVDLSSLPAARALDGSQVRELFHTLLQQALIELHTFDPDEAHIEAWLGGLYRLQQRFYVDVDRYAAAVARPDPEKVRRYIAETGFYDRKEPIIATARALQRQGEGTRDPAQVREALAADACSHYAQALKKGCGYLLAANAFFAAAPAGSADEADVQALRKALDIGRPV
jgi:hypothetical protein